MITKEFVTAGRAIFTSSNNKGVHYTYKVTCGKRSPQKTMVDSPLYIWLLTAPDQYTYLGMMVNDQCILTYKSKMNKESLPIRVFDYTMKVINGTIPLPTGYNIQHEGRCAKCARALTDPISISTGLGPYCRGVVRGN